MFVAFSPQKLYTRRQSESVSLPQATILSDNHHPDRVRLHQSNQLPLLLHTSSSPTSHHLTLMAGTKRSWEGTLLRDKDTQADTADVTMSDQSSQILSIFGTFRDELDEHHDRRERLTKISRDITALSKKMYLSLLCVLNADIYANKL